MIFITEQFPASFGNNTVTGLNPPHHKDFFRVSFSYTYGNALFSNLDCDDLELEW